MKGTAVRPEVLGAIENLQRLAELFHRRREQLARDADLTVAQWRVLVEISDEHFMPSMFARERESTPAAVSKILRQLQDSGLVSASIDRRDGRQRRYALTAKGRRTMRALRSAREEAIGAIWMDLDPKRLESFTVFSAELIRRLERHAQDRNGER